MSAPSAPLAAAALAVGRASDRVLGYDGAAPASSSAASPLKIIPVRAIINLHKGLVGVSILLLYWLHGVRLADDTRAGMYLGMHAAYGACWVLKDLTFPDPAWAARVTPLGALASNAVLTLYLAAPLAIARGSPPLGGATAALATAAYGVGMCLHFASDAQKHFTLAHKRGLISTGLFAYTRNPNYLGEMLIYSSFALLAHHPAPWAANAFIWCLVWTPNMVKKDRRLARHSGWAAYTRTAWAFLPNPAGLLELRRFF